MIQFNWFELNKISTLPEGHVILIFGLYVGIHKRMSSTTKLLKQKLNIKLIPNRLLTENYILDYPQGVFSNYKTIEPQCYIKNCSFLHLRLDPGTKSDYIRILSQRPIGDNTFSIPRHYLEPRLQLNPLIELTKTKIILPLEKL
jgi:hypothetical protein